MTPLVIYINDQGGVSVVHPTPEALALYSIEAIAEKDVPAGKSFKIVEDGNIPTDRTFRNAWKLDGDKVGHDIVKCKTIAHDKRRAARAAEFAPLDVEATIPAKAAAAELKRKAVRDKYDAIQVEIDSAASVDQLRAIVNSLQAK